LLLLSAANIITIDRHGRAALDYVAINGDKELYLLQL
jgi:hypothetical protein